MSQESKKHAEFSASSAHRWLNCPGSVELCKKAPPQPESKYALEGTTAHSFLEQILREYVSPKGSLVKTCDSLKRKDSVMFEHAFMAFQRIREMYLESPDAEILIEEKIEIPFNIEGLEPQFGTVDCALVEHFGTLSIIDFKYGAGVAVEAEDNAQMAFYAVGLAKKYDFNFETVRFVIIQPRTKDGGDGVKIHSIPILELREWESHFENGIKRAKSKGAGLVPGDKQCRFCPAKVICPEFSTNALSKAKIEFDPIEEPNLIALPSLKTLTPEKAGVILDAYEYLQEWAEAVKTYAFNALERGEQVPGWKLVDKRAIRKWTGLNVEDEAVKKFGTAALSEPELLSPAQFEKKLKSKEAFDFVAKNAQAVSSGVTLVRDSDTRNAITVTHEYDEVVE